MRAGQPRAPERPLTGHLSLPLVLFFPRGDAGHLLLPDTQKKTPTTISGSPHTLKSSSTPCPATQGRSWRKRRKVRCPCPDGLRGPGGWGAEGRLPEARGGGCGGRPSVIRDGLTEVTETPARVAPGGQAAGTCAGRLEPVFNGTHRVPAGCPHRDRSVRRFPLPEAAVLGPRHRRGRLVGRAAPFGP